MNVSVIIPIYNGNKYINGLMDMIKENASEAKGLIIELILVNDSPDIPLKYDKKKIDGFYLNIVENPYNMGIQRARITGINAAHGQYVVLLDQDDIITKNAINLQYKLIGDADLIIANGYNEEEDKSKKLLFSSKKQQNYVKNINFFCYLGNLIVSPGMCMMRKDSIPSYWMENPLHVNGADDWLLWILYLMDNKQIVLSNKIIYTHRNVGTNCSANSEQMLNSSEEAVAIAEKYKKDFEKKFKVYRRRLRMRRFYEGKSRLKKVVAYIINPDITWYLFQLKNNT